MRHLRPLPQSHGGSKYNFRPNGIKGCNVQCNARPVKVLLTRELGKNSKLANALLKLKYECIELPLIEHSPGPDRDRLPVVLRQHQFDWITLTSPEAASVFLEAWKTAGTPEVRIAVVGDGTGEVVRKAGLQPAFTASQATGKTLGSELPRIPSGNGQVLYPASVKAGNDVASSCEAAGFQVTRLNTYNTTGVQAVPPEMLSRALEADVVTYGSPSAVKSWIALVGLDVANTKLNVCIGATSGTVCNALGMKQVYYPESPGISGWVDMVVQAVEQAGLQKSPQAVA